MTHFLLQAKNPVPFGFFTTHIAPFMLAQYTYVPESDAVLTPLPSGLCDALYTIKCTALEHVDALKFQFPNVF